MVGPIGAVDGCVAALGLMALHEGGENAGLLVDRGDGLDHTTGSAAHVVGRGRARHLRIDEVARYRRDDALRGHGNPPPLEARLLTVRASVEVERALDDDGVEGPEEDLAVGSRSGEMHERRAREQLERRCSLHSKFGSSKGRHARSLERGWPV